MEKIHSKGQQSSSMQMKRVHYKPIAPLRDSRLDHFSATDDEKYWQGMQETAVFETHNHVTSCSIAPMAPFNLASTSGTELSTIDLNTCEPLAIYSRFKQRLHSAKYRADGALLGVSTHSGELQFFDVHMEPHKKHGARNAIRTFRAHSCPVNSFDYQLNGRKVCSAGDDGFVKLFDLASENSVPLWEHHAHMDSIPSVASSPISEHLVATGSYDHTVKLWDIREEKAKASVKQFDHGDPVERIIYFPNGKTLASAGGPMVKLWDLNTGSLLAEFSNHSKTITSICLAANAQCMLTGGVDRRVNFVRLDNAKYPVLHSISVEYPVLALAISPDDTFAAFGISNRLAIYRRQSVKEEDEKIDRKRKRRPKDVKGFEEPIVVKKTMFGHEREAEIAERKAPVIVKHDREEGTERTEMELTERQLDKMSLGPYDRLLRSGSYRELVGKLMRSTEARPELVVATFGQIRIRQCLRQALSDHGKQELNNLFFFLRQHLFTEPYFDILHDVTVEALDIYAGKAIQKEVRHNIFLLEKQISCEVRNREELCASSGILRMVMYWNEKNEQQRRNNAKNTDQNGDDHSGGSEVNVRKDVDDNAEGKLRLITAQDLPQIRTF